MMPGSTAALEVRALGYRIGGAEIVSDLSLQVRHGELLGIIGPNGAGKTTLFNLMSGLARPTTGSVFLEGLEVTGLPPYKRAELGLGRTFQTSALFGALSVHENVRLAAQTSLGGSLRFWRLPRRGDEAGARTMSALAEVGLAELAGRPAASLSHGDKRKLELAILIASGARIMMLDEPMAGVNRADMPMLAELIASLRAKGNTVVMVEHHMPVVLDLADRVAVIHQGRLLACDEPEKVMENQTVQDAYVGEPL